jgi:acetyl-CoA carboxylase biotin carboxyl carrier protein
LLTGEDLQALVAQLDASDLDEFEVQIRDMTVVLRRHGAGGWTKEAVVTRHPRVFGEPAPDPVDPGPIVGTHALDGGQTPVASAVDEANRSAVYPPLLGTFYRAPSPDAPSFVEVGDVVTPDTVVGIVETMKMMNSVPAGVAGTVVEIVKGNAEFTDSGDVLMWIETTQ